MKSRSMLACDPPGYLKSLHAMLKRSIFNISRIRPLSITYLSRQYLQDDCMLALDTYRSRRNHQCASTRRLILFKKTNSDLSQNETDPHELMAALGKHDQGIVHLGDDGVLRSFAPNGTVLEYVKLSTNQIQQMLDSHGRTDHLTEVYDGVDGREVTDLEQLTNPGEHLLPKVPFTDSTLSAGATNGKSLQHFIYVKW